jgi:hypothetical protein
LHHVSVWNARGLVFLPINFLSARFVTYKNRVNWLKCYFNENCFQKRIKSLSINVRHFKKNDFLRNGVHNCINKIAENKLSTSVRYVCVPITTYLENSCNLKYRERKITSMDRILPYRHFLHIKCLKELKMEEIEW